MQIQKSEGGENGCCSNRGRIWKALTPRYSRPREAGPRRVRAYLECPGPFGAGFENLFFSVMGPYLFVTFRTRKYM